MDKQMNYWMDKLRHMAERFNQQFDQKRYAQAAYIYDSAHRIAIFLELPRDEMYELFGYGEDGEEEETDNGLFKHWKIDMCNWKHCIIQNKTYQDIALRRTGEPVRYYSDEDFCAQCKKRAVP